MQDPNAKTTYPTAPNASLNVTADRRHKTLIFHIGDPKTGSSSIQRALFDGSWSSPGASLAYPDQLNEIPLAKSLYPESPPAQSQQKFSATAEWLLTRDEQVAVLSAEHFSFVPPQVLQTAVAQYMPDCDRRIHVLAYVRPHASRLLSTYAQRVKTRGLQDSFEDFVQNSIRRGDFLYTPRFEKWRQVFGAAFTLRPFVREQLHQGDVVADFLHTALGGGEIRLTGAAAQNESPTLAHLACLQLVQQVLRRAGMAQPLRHALCSSLAKKLACGPSAAGPRLKMPASLLSQLVEAYREDAAAMDAAFFEGTPMSDALAATERSASSQPQSVAARDHLSVRQRKGLRAIALALSNIPDAASSGWLRRHRKQRRTKDGTQMPPSATDAQITALLDEACQIFEASA